VTAQQAAAWVRLRRAELAVRVLLVVAWAVALGFAIAPPGAACTPAEPLRCTTDVTGGVALGLMLLAPVLLALAPLLGCGALVLFGVLDVAFDADPTARLGWGALAILAVVAAAGLVALRTAQRRLAGAAGPAPVEVPRIEPDVSRDVRAGRAVAAVVLALAGVVLAVLYVRAAGDVADRERAAERRTAVVTAHDDEVYGLRLDLAPDLVVPVYDVGVYPVGSRLPVLVDGAGEDLWVRPAAEPEDVAWWLMLATAALLAAGLLEASRRRGQRRRRDLLTRGVGGPVLLWAPNDAGHAVLQADGVVLGVVPVLHVHDDVAGPHDEDAVDEDAVDEDAVDEDEDEDDLDEDDFDDEQVRAEVVRVFGQAWRGEDVTHRTALWQPVTVVGDLNVGGWVVLVLEDGVLLPDGPLRSRLGRGHPRPGAPGPARVESDSGLPPVILEDLPGLPVAPAPAAVAALGDGRVVLTPALRDRLLGTGLLVVAAALLAAVPSPLPEGLYQQVMLGVLGAEALVLGWRRWNRRVVADRRSVAVPGPWRTYHVPWQAVHGVRRDGDRLALAWEDEAIVVGPFAGPGGAETVAARAGATLAALQERAAALAAPDAPIVTRTSPLAGLVVGYALLVLTLIVG
jgi:hypothetical protein